MEGYQVLFNEQLTTVWSAPNYCYRCGNVASVLEINEHLEGFLNVFSEAPGSLRESPPTTPPTIANLVSTFSNKSTKKKKRTEQILFSILFCDKEVTIQQKVDSIRKCFLTELDRSVALILTLNPLLRSVTGGRRPPPLCDLQSLAVATRSTAREIAFFHSSRSACDLVVMNHAVSASTTLKRNLSFTSSSNSVDDIILHPICHTLDLVPSNFSESTPFAR